MGWRLPSHYRNLKTSVLAAFVAAPQREYGALSACCVLPVTGSASQERNMGMQGRARWATQQLGSRLRFGYGAVMRWCCDAGIRDSKGRIAGNHAIVLSCRVF